MCRKLMTGEKGTLGTGSGWGGVAQTMEDRGEESGGGVQSVVNRAGVSRCGQGGTRHAQVGVRKEGAQTLRELLLRHNTMFTPSGSKQPRLSLKILSAKALSIRLTVETTPRCLRASLLRPLKPSLDFHHLLSGSSCLLNGSLGSVPE